MRDDLRRLIAAWPLPPGYGEPQLFSDEITIAGVAVQRAGIQVTTPQGMEITGSAATLAGSPVERAYFELLERVAVVEAPDISAGTDERSRHARSNGVALHTSWDEACRRARCELVERDRVLGAWYGELPLLAARSPAWLDAFDVTHEWIARLVPAAPGDADADLAVALVIGFPREAGLPLARGFAGGASQSAALDAAALEAVQSLAFVWGEPLPADAPALAPTPMFHLDYYLWPGSHAALREWLDVAARVVPRAGAVDPTDLVDITPPSFEDRLRVARAVRHSARPLVFGELQPALRAQLPAARHVHPIA